ncbi:MAG: hypothetical protein ACOZNI_33445 [Myxococcota bacterium]
MWWTPLILAADAQPDPIVRLLAVLDGDGDGRLSAAEFARVTWPGTEMAPFDADASGDLDAVELRAMVWAASPLPPDHLAGPPPDAPKPE